MKLLIKKLLINIFNFFNNKIFKKFGLIIKIEKLDVFFDYKKNSTDLSYFYYFTKRLNLELNNIARNNKPNIYVLTPTLKEKHTYAGIRMIITLAYVLYKRGYLVRFIATQETDKNLKSLFKKNIQSYFQDFILDHEQDIYVSSEKILYNKDDIFIATAWWTIYNLGSLDFNKIKVVYLVQDYEPAFYPWGMLYYLANNTYKYSVSAIYSTNLLKKYFNNNLNIKFKKETFYEIYINNNIYPFEKSKKVSKNKKLLFYGRPNVERNLFHLGILVIANFIQRNLELLKDWEFISAGENHPNIKLSDKFVIKSIGKLSYKDYAELLRDSDIGLSLMYSPHPSYPPYEMAGCGMLVVTNNDFGKNLSTISKNIISSDSSVESLVQSLELALSRVNDYDERIKNSNLKLPKSIEECFKGPIKMIEEMVKKNY